jgi:hypothetical protein
LVNKLDCKGNILSQKRLMPNAISSCDQLKPTAPNRDGKKIVIGTEVSNALITSSIRLDCKEAPVIGSTVSGFDLNSINYFLSQQRYL